MQKIVANQTAIDGELDHDGGHRRRYITGRRRTPRNVIAFPDAPRSMGTRHSF
jgi:hypothetical protein